MGSVNIATSDLFSSMTGTTPLPSSPGDRLLEPLLQFTDGWFLLDLFLSYFFTILLAALLTWSPARVPGAKAKTIMQSDGILLLLGIIGVTVAELVSLMPAMALVIFGIGGLIRFRTSFKDTELTGKGIIIVIIGLACGLGQIAMACFVTLVSWCILWLLESRVSCLVRVTAMDGATLSDSAVGTAVVKALRKGGARLRSTDLSHDMTTLDIYVTVPSRHTYDSIRSLVMPALPDPSDDSQVQIEFK